MKLDAIVANNLKRVATNSDHTELNLYGLLEPDYDDAFIRLYRDPGNRRSYFLLKRSDVTGEIYELSKEELTSLGFVGTTLYRVPLAHGVDVQVVSITHEKLGETIAGDSFAPHVKALSTGQCHNSSGCGSHKCCTDASDGKCYCDDCCVA